MTDGGTGQWLGVGEAARRADKTTRTIQRWVDDGLVTGRRGATGHRQVLLSSLEAVLDSPRNAPLEMNPTAGLVTAERWVREATVMRLWKPPRALSYQRAVALQAALGAVQEALDNVSDELDLFVQDHWDDAEADNSLAL